MCVPRLTYRDATVPGEPLAYEEHKPVQPGSLLRSDFTKRQVDIDHGLDRIAHHRVNPQAVDLLRDLVSLLRERGAGAGAVAVAGAGAAAVEHLAAHHQHQQQQQHRL